MKKILILVIMGVALFGCSNDDSPELRIRLSNASKLDFKDITVNTSDEDVSFENISAGNKTMYKTFSQAYRYAFVELQIDGKTYTLQPIDYVGETLLEKGNYTYEITANDSQERYGKLWLKLVKD